jgi:hypothetical protein
MLKVKAYREFIKWATWFESTIDRHADVTSRHSKKQFVRYGLDYVNELIQHTKQEIKVAVEESNNFYFDSVLKSLQKLNIIADLLYPIDKVEIKSHITYEELLSKADDIIYSLTERTDIDSVFDSLQEQYNGYFGYIPKAIIQELEQMVKEHNEDIEAEEQEALSYLPEDESETWAEFYKAKGVK